MLAAPLLPLLLLLLPPSPVAAQARAARDWRARSPPDKSFTVELPAPLTRVKSFDGEHGVDFDDDWDRPGVRSYAAVETSRDDCRFGIVVIAGRARAAFLRAGPKEEMLRYLSVLLVGDDDDPRPDTERGVRAGGLAGREYFYVRDEELIGPLSGVGEIHTRGRIFDDGRRIYVLVFVGRSTDDLTSADAERFFNSFRPRGRVNKLTPPVRVNAGRRS